MAQDDDPYWPPPHVWGSFASGDEFNRLVNETLWENRSVIDAMRAGERTGAALVTRQFDEVTGRESYRPRPGAKPEIRETTGVTVVVIAARDARGGFHLVTAYPSTLPFRQRRNMASSFYRRGRIPGDAYDFSELVINGYNEYYQTNEDWLADFARFASLGRNHTILRDCFEELSGQTYSNDELAYIWTEDFAFDFLLPKTSLRGAFGIMRENIGLKPVVGPRQFKETRKIAGAWRSWPR